MRYLPFIFIMIWPRTAIAELVEWMPNIEHVEVSCSKIRLFHDEHLARTYAKLKGYMVIHEQGQNIWRTMPKFDSMLIGACYQED